MKILAADDEKYALSALTEAIAEAVPEAELKAFSKVSDVVRELRENSYQPDVAFIDIEMPGMSGLELAHVIKECAPQSNVVFVTGFSQYALEAIATRPSGYVMKPPTKRKIMDEIENLRNPIINLAADGRLRVQTFGNFEVFFDERPVRFQYSKTKELLAYLVDRHGALSTNHEIMAVLWEDECSLTSKTPYFKKLRADLLVTLAEINCSDVISKQRGKLGICPEMLNCDYYDWLDNKLYAINAYRGEYMTQYSWGEMTHGVMEK